jgi:hypothetical protein
LLTNKINKNECSRENALRSESKTRKRKRNHVNSQPLKAFMMSIFIKLRTAKSNTEAFNQVNEDYYGLFGHYRYSDWNTFKE